MTTSAPSTYKGLTEEPAPAEQDHERRRFRLRRPSAWHLVLIPTSAILLFPFYLMVVTSLQTEAQTRRFPPLLTPPTPQWSNYADALNAAPFVRFMINSAVVALIIVAGNLVLCSIAGYAFARLRFAGRGIVFGLLMATLMVPFQVTMIPEFLIVKWLGTNVWDQLGIDHLGALVLPSLATAFGIFFLRQFFMTVPIELEEAARMDGTSRLGVLFKIVLPLSLPALSTVAAISFLDAWNSFLWPLIVINTESHMTLPLGLTTFQGSHDTHWELLMAGNVFSLVPMLLVFFVAQRYFVRSVAATGLKG
jgi:multiple sugar transport system permease protein